MSQQKNTADRSGINWITLLNNIGASNISQSTVQMHKSKKNMAQNKQYIPV